MTTWKSPCGPTGCCARSAATGPSRAIRPSFCIAGGLRIAGRQRPRSPDRPTDRPCRRTRAFRRSAGSFATNDRSLLAKTAALRLLEAKAGEAAKPDLAATLRKGPGRLPRAPARWVLAWLQAQAGSPGPCQLLDATGRRGRRTAVPAAARHLAGDRRGPAAIANRGPAEDRSRGRRRRSVEQLIRLRRGEPAELARLLNWLIDQKDWPATRLVEKRCQAAIAESADLLYLRRRGPSSPRRCGRRGTIGRPGPEAQPR